ncbi:MAG: hypothetical protein IKX35_08400 [Bacteroidales bacterium]|nr:hypothetical protein [Bacteroidales bacterium]
MMKSLVVIDACSLINLLRIDEDDDFLYKHLKLFDIHIAKTVYDELLTNVFKNSIDVADKKRISVVLSLIQTDFTLHQDEEIFNDIGRVFLDKTVHYTNHHKKPNGELCSTLLSLVLSRSEESKICFITDDFPAKEQFKCFFSVQQIGVIQDSIDLLISMHWLSPQEEFPLNTLKHKLIDLRAECVRNLKVFLDDVSSIKRDLRRTDKEWKLLDDVEHAFYNSSGKWEDFSLAINAIRESNSKKVRRLRDRIPITNESPKMVKKVNFVLGELNKVEIFKLV